MDLSLSSSFVSDVLLQPYLKDALALDGVVTLVDAKHLLNSLKKRTGELSSVPSLMSIDSLSASSPNELNEAYEQIAVADRILINKIDLVQPQVCQMESRDREREREREREIHARSPLLTLSRRKCLISRNECERLIPTQTLYAQSTYIPSRFSLLPHHSVLSLGTRASRSAVCLTSRRLTFSEYFSSTTPSLASSAPTEHTTPLLAR
jgi:hypothetical protein